MSTEQLMSNLFSNLQQTNERLEKLHVLPNFSGGVDLRSRSGEVLSSYQPGVGVADGVILDGAGQKVAHVRDHVAGGTTFDFGGGHTVSTYSNVSGGETFHSSIEGVVGYTQPAFGGGMQFHGANGERMLAQSDPISGGIGITSSPAPTLPDLHLASFHASPLDSLDAASGVLDTAELGSLGVESLGIFQLIGDFL
ncbi:hypothetical protein JCM9140_2532 [Halalkalibacter wakoensis JCM 9140]|uniref:Uncharacterized protein n=1 Tax=Halalkalibacter wakoensis JCM 9140 TaxID=1236970 RepID=W4Q443_9BACI|nr:hypothetical protein [Halalkalibacter wakoensis]GAE26463.1 hypothetical protein JCM9140_2532 [Halalkalibacter wakoensis JCM 9140]